MCSMVFITTLIWLIGTRASASDYDFSEKNNGVTLYYKIDPPYRDCVTVVGCGLPMSNGIVYYGVVVIPKKVTYNRDTYIVHKIEKSAFQGRSGLTSVTIPNSVTYIPEFAFWYCI